MKIQMQGMPDKKSEMVKAEDALKGRSEVMEVDERHYVLKNPMMLSQEVNRGFLMGNAMGSWSKH